jgi:hypothetical protein
MQNIAFFGMFFIDNDNFVTTITDHSPIFNAI